jgi:hypothetical protein
MRRNAACVCRALLPASGLEDGDIESGKVVGIGEIDFDDFSAAD